MRKKPKKRNEDEAPPGRTAQGLRGACLSLMQDGQVATWDRAAYAPAGSFLLTWLLRDA